AISRAAIVAKKDNLGETLPRLEVHHLEKACPCFRFRGNSMPPFGNLYYDDEDVEFENLLSNQDRTGLINLLSGRPFSRSNHPPTYGRASMVIPNEDALLEDDTENLQTQDAQFLPDEQINKFSERVKHHPATDAQLEAEEEEIRRQEEEEIRKKRQAATQAALAKGLITPEQASANTESSTKSQDVTPYNLDSQVSSLNKPRNPHERLFTPDVNMEDYDDAAHQFQRSNCNQRSSDLLTRRHSRRSLMRDNEQKMEDYSPFSVSILRSDDYVMNQEDYSPTVGDEELVDPFEKLKNIVPAISGKFGFEYRKYMSYTPR
ncbi:9748_t:CDS:2, partial [Gigaspora margarita]